LLLAFKKCYNYLVDFQRTNSYSVLRLTGHIFLGTMNQYAIFEDDVKIRCRIKLIRICEAEDIQILKEVVSKDQIHIEY
jgi:putative transposase